MLAGFIAWIAETAIGIWIRGFFKAKSNAEAANEIAQKQVDILSDTHAPDATERLRRGDF